MASLLEVHNARRVFFRSCWQCFAFSLQPKATPMDPAGSRWDGPIAKIENRELRAQDRPASWFWIYPTTDRFWTTWDYRAIFGVDLGSTHSRDRQQWRWERYAANVVYVVWGTLWLISSAQTSKISLRRMMEAFEASRSPLPIGNCWNSESGLR